ncbi:hypothetical protein [Marinifilum caeruleilacunae]|uniref:Transcriptional regulator n=1 Tax=Marinifilum caeruleilacunae TaxID=2499076 RepID=A0ABX1X1Q9_9BACT|nr:hypothetical protein [Marinifilum caeruleilacunae]NOU62343.1 hypothetical protein [Marinifilum caeruleilacunae]
MKTTKFSKEKIESQDDYNQVMSEIDGLVDCPDYSEEFYRLVFLSKLIEDYDIETGEYDF